LKKGRPSGSREDAARWCGGLMMGKADAAPVSSSLGSISVRTEDRPDARS
jgi:hypothetical protein